MSIARESNSEKDERDFFAIIRRIRAQPGEPMSLEEIQAEVATARSERRDGKDGQVFIIVPTPSREEPK